jgi:SP family general alpha glucoside:H+ symporter-like MFS transporter
MNEFVEPVQANTASNVTLPLSGLPHGIPNVVSRLQELSVSANAATEAERRMTFLEGCRLYPKAIAWSALVSSAIIMEAYDKSLVSNFFGFPEFRRAFGSPVNPNTPQDRTVFEISSAWQSGLNNAALAGEIIGLFANGSFNDRIGYRRTSIAALIWLVAWIFLSFFSINIQMLAASQVLSGKSCIVPDHV